MADKGTVFQTGGGGVNFEQTIQAAFLVTLLVKGNAPALPSNEITEIVLQASNRGWETDDLLVLAKSELHVHTVLIQVKHNLTFSSDNTVFREVIAAFWKDFNSSSFNKANDRLVIAKSRLNNIEKNQIKILLNYAKSHNSANDFLSEVNRVKAKTDKLEEFREALQKANNNIPVRDAELWQFLRVLDVLGYDFLNEGSIDETYILNLIRLSRNLATTATEKHIWNEVIALIGKSNPSGASFNISSPQLEELYHYFDPARTYHAYSAVKKLREDSEGILLPLKSTIRSAGHELYIDRPALMEDIITAILSNPLTIVTGKPGAGKSAAVKQCLAEHAAGFTSFVFRADQFNQPHLANVMTAMGVQDSLTDIFSCIALQPEKVIFIDSMEKLLENADPDSAFKQLLVFSKKYNIRIVCTSRTYAVDLLVQKFGIESSDLKTIPVPVLSDEELTQAVLHFPVLTAAVKNMNIRSLLRSPKYLDFTVRAIVLSPDDFSASSLIEFKEKLWASIVCNAGYKVRGLPAKREKAFLEIAVSRAREMALFAKPVNADDEAVDLLENDDIIFQDGTKRRYAASHDILEDWALTRNVASCFDEHSDTKKFLNALGSEPAIRRAFRLWIEDQLLEGLQKIVTLTIASLADTTIESFWSDELLVAIFKSDDCAPFFTTFESTLLENKAALLNRCMHIIKTACKETNYEVSKEPILMPVGSGWQQMLLFLSKNISKLNSLRSAILNFLYDWDSRLIFEYPKDKNELEAAKQITLFYINQAGKKSKFWDGRTNTDNKELLVDMLFNLALISKEEITSLVHRAISKRDDRSGWHSSNILDIVLKKLCYGPGKHRMAYALPDLVLEAAIKRWKYKAPTPRNEEERSLFKSFSPSSITREHCWGVNSTFGFSPSGIYKTPVYLISVYHPFKTINFITQFINYSVSHYLNSDCDYKHEVYEIELTLSDGTIVKQWGGWELYVAYRGLSVTDYLLESLLMALEKLLFDMAVEGSIKSLDALKYAFDYLLRNSNNVMTTGVLASVTMAYPKAVGESFLPLVTIKEIYYWDFQRVRSEPGALAPYDEQISAAQKVRYESNQLPHRTRYSDGFGGFLIDYQFTIRTYNEQLFITFDKFWAELRPEDIVWNKKLHEIDSRKWQVTKHEPGTGQFHIQPGYDESVKAFIDLGKPEMDAVNTAATNSQALTKVLKEEQDLDYKKWVEYYDYYSSLEAFDSRFDKPVTFAVIGLKRFNNQLSEEQQAWCINHLAVTIGFILGSLRNYDFGRPPLYNYMEQDTALQSLHILLSAVTETKDIKELTYLTGYVLASPFPDHERDTLDKYFRETFAVVFPEILYRVWSMLLQLARYKKENPYYYDDPDRRRLTEARKKELKFIEKLCKSSRIPRIDFSQVTFTNSRADILMNALQIIPSSVVKEDYKKYLLRFLDLLALDLPEDTDHNFGPNRGGKQLQHQAVFAVEKYIAEVLLQADISFSKELLERLLLIAKITSGSYYHSDDPVKFVIRTLENVVYSVNDCLESNEDTSKHNVIIGRFWILWDHLEAIIKIKENQVFIRVLLLNTDYFWPMELRDSALLRGRGDKYFQAMYSVGPSAVPSAVKIFSTIGSVEFLPAGLSSIVSLLKKDIKYLENVSIAYLNQLIKILFVEHIAKIKRDQRLVAEFLWLLDRLIENGNSTAYLYRENVIIYKKFN